MAGSTQSGLLIVPPSAAVVGENRRRQCRRRVSPRAGRALEILGHAIEYVTDEYVLTGGSLSDHSSQLEAVQLLMALNREIYLECPEVPSISERFWSLLHLRAA